MSKAAIYSPYLDTFGGGEKYMMTIAELLVKENLEVDVLLDNHLKSVGADYLKSELSKRFALNLDRINFNKAPVGAGSTVFLRSFFLSNYDILFYLTDGSIFYPTSKKNILHIQSPLAGQPAKSTWGKLKLKGWDLIIYNSNFTRKHSEKNWPIKSEIIYPPVDVSKIKPLGKKKYILSVGRFFGYLRSKKHEILIKVFRELYEAGQLKDWKLILAGAASEGDKPYLDELRKMSQGLPVNYYPNIEYDELVKLYGQSSLYWHAAGFGETDPTKMEHFGISTVEAMAGGCVPVVVGSGGQTEIVENGKTGFLWNSVTELKKYTILLTKDQKLVDKLSSGALFASRRFSKLKFEERIKNLLKNQ